ncbi:hypothetical protein BRADI_3g30075v3 [Brachypodium distachyon]|uniref:Uncharacterized protein n=1 Tax=Brachypodium distachyon TaxID=15368 RepID=A0A2K2D051_BRADI|nr:hypothetical protein BRADI_3g30075v3 [Brachypodium distachyon]
MVRIDDALEEILRYLPDQCEAAAISIGFPDDTIISLRSKIAANFSFFKTNCSKFISFAHVSLNFTFLGEKYPWTWIHFWEKSVRWTVVYLKICL